MKKAANKKSLFIKILIALNLTASFSLILSYTAGFFSPQKITFLGYFALAYIVILAVNVMFTFIWLFIKRKYALFNLILILAGWNLIWNHFNIGIKNDLNTENQIKIISYNTHNFALKHPDSNLQSNINNILHYIKENKAHLACFQEFFTCKPRDTIRNDSILKALNYKYYYFKTYVKPDKYRKMDAIATFSVFPIIKNVSLFDSKMELFGIYSDIVINIDTIRLYNIHLCSIRLNSTTDSTQGKALYKIGKAFKQRAKEVDFLRENIKKSPYPIFICGDFNDTPASYAYQQLINELDDTYQASATNTGNTYFWNIPPIRIDNILINKNYKVISYQTDKMSFSDHYAVVAQIKKR